MEKGTSEIELTGGMTIIIRYDKDNPITGPMDVTCNGVSITLKEAQQLITEATEEIRKGET